MRDVQQNLYTLSFNWFLQNWKLFVSCFNVKKMYVRHTAIIYV